MDFIFNGQASGSVAQMLLKSGGDINVLRPYLGADGRSYITRNERGTNTAIPITNAEATLRKDDWIQLDTAIVKAAKARLRFVADVRAAGLQYSIPNGMGKTVLQTQTQSDISAADINMNGLSKSKGDRPEFDLSNLPLPIVHKEFSFDLRSILASRNGGSPLDTTTAELAARNVAEGVENLALGNSSSFNYGGGTVYGLLNFPSRITKTVVSPTSSAWTPAKTVADVLNMKARSMAKNHFGPWRLYVGAGWDEYMDNDYSSTKGDLTLRERLKKIENIQDVITLDYLPSFNLCLVQMTSDVVRMVVGMEISTVQWESQGGMEQNFKVMCIMVPQLRADHNGNTGIVHGSV